MPTLYLLPDERVLLEQWPEPQRQAATVEVEQTTYTDTPEEFLARCELMELRSPELQTVQAAMADCATEEDVMALLQKVDMQALSDDDARELFFAMGPEVMGLCIRQMLSSPLEGDSLAWLADFTAIRHTLLASLS